eukprot:TRINITY_DN4533_c0_g1_i1.p1 TRINITY_DN4533_c0_g1~~TRINITY_DN4533_c0_g1_i1.p1  ORF type:complete len:167 (-),score=32.20 TRINITY_DN4533_c0_g1_i1:72-512(-)
MSTRAVASAIFPLPIDQVWQQLRDFTFPGKLISTIESCTINENKSPDSVGAIRVTTWKSGEIRKDRLIALSDQYRNVTWELVEANHETESLAAITTIRLVRVTELNHTLVEWSCDYSADVSNDFVLFNQKAFLQNLVEMRGSLTKK